VYAPTWEHNGSISDLATLEEAVASSKEPERRAPTRFDRFAAVVVLTLFAVTWPVLDLLGENAEFFLARRSPKGEILLLGLALTLLVPVALALLGALPGRMGAVVGSGLIALLSVLLAFLYLRRLPLPPWATSAVALVVGCLVVWVFHRFDNVRQGARYLILAPVLCLVVFLVATPAGAVLIDRGTGIGTPVSVANPVPVLMVVLDEFPLASLIDPAGNLRVERYPNLARLAADGVWYRNAVTVEQQTEHSVPAMLTGSVPDQSLTPFAGQYPNNLFTALQEAYDLEVHETITRLCPISLCESTPSTSAPLLEDLGIVAGHVLLPDPLSENLPAIDRSWGDFRAAIEDFDAKAEFRRLLKVDPRLPVEALVEDMRTGTTKPPLYYLHILIPHHPWQFLPDGRRYALIEDGNPAARGGGWSDDEFLVAQTMQRHLLQVGYADRVIGLLMTELQQAGLYDEAMIVVVADHGVAIEPGVFHQRIITETTVGDIAPVPLFIKAPDVAGGIIDDRRALTIDILPTIADVVGADIPWDMDGSSLLDAPAARLETTTVGPQGSVTYGVSGHEKLEVAARIDRLFPNGDPWALRPAGAPDLLGQDLDVSVLSPSSLTWRMKQPELYQGVDLSGDVAPVRVGGALVGDADGTEVLTVVVNGVIGAVTRSYVKDGKVFFLAMFPPDLLRAGDNQIDLALVTADGDLQLVARG
jgi:hypothetical protein